MSTATSSKEILFRQTQGFLGLEVVVSALAIIFAIAIGTPISITVSTVALAVFVLAAFRVNALLYAAVLFMPLEPVLTTSFPIHDVSSILRITMFVGFCVGVLLDGHSFRSWFQLGRLSYFAIAYGLVAVISVIFFNKMTPLAGSALALLFSELCFYFVIIGWVRTERQVKVIISLLLLSTLLVAIFGIYQAVIGDLGGLYFWLYPGQQNDLPLLWTGRITSFLNYYNTLAGYLNLALPFALGCLGFRVGGRLRLLAAACLATASIALILTQSRGGVFAFGGTIVLAIFLLMPRASNRKGLVIAACIAGFLAVPILMQFSTRFGTIQDESGLERLVIWGDALGMFLASPILGVGYGNFRSLFALPGMQPGSLDVNNLWLQIPTETGLVGLVIFGFLMVIAMRVAWSQLHRPQSFLDGVIGFGSFAALVSVLTHGFVDSLFNVSGQFGALFWMILGILTAREHFRKTPDYGNV